MIARASASLSTSTSIQALCTPLLHPHSALVRKCEPRERKTCTARVHSSVSASCGTSIRNLATSSLLGSLIRQDDAELRAPRPRFHLELPFVLAYDAARV